MPQKIKPLKTGTCWDNDHLQFARLLAEIQMTGPFIISDELKESMDLEENQIQEIFDRAQDAFDEWKASDQWKKGH